MNKIIQGDCLEKLKELEDNSVDSIVTDPPYELGFMGKSWDSTGIANNKDMWAECLRVLKPGGHLLAFSGTRTYHRMASAIEDAGFEVRDMIEWVYGSGFPKSLNIGKAVDKLQGNDRNVVGKSDSKGIKSGAGNYVGDKYECDGYDITKGTSEWEGWGTALKPAHEPICMARKPLAEKTVAENCLKYGTGGINIDESRVDYTSEKDKIEGQSARASLTKGNDYTVHKSMAGMDRSDRSNISGRFPSNLLHDNSEEVRECFPDTKSVVRISEDKDEQQNTWSLGRIGITPRGHNDSGNASRFFKSIIYQAKASKSERNKGCEGLEEKVATARMNSSEFRYEEGREPTPRAEQSLNKNNHPTVKPIALMEYLIKMVTPKGGIVLDPFAGSGSTLVAAKQNGFQYIGIEMTEEYIPIIEARLNSVENNLFNVDNSTS